MTRTILISVALLGNAAALENRHVFYSEGEIVGFGDFDGDGFRDTVVADRETGQLRIGYGAADGSLTWEPPIPTGIGGASGLATGVFNHPAGDQIAVTGPLANRIVVVNPNNSYTRAKGRQSPGGRRRVALRHRVPGARRE